MESKENGKSVQASPKSDVGDAAGWLFRFIQEGWLRKRWRKRWCILNKGKLYFYEYEARDTADKNCGHLDLALYQKCLKASKKDCKKSPLTFVLELPSKKEEKDAKNDLKNKASLKVQREVLYVNTETEFENWISKLNEAIAIARMGIEGKLEHVTKARAKPPAAKRRPPTRQHLRDRATICEISLDLSTEADKKIEKTKRGHVPTSAIKPPPPGSTKDKRHLLPDQQVTVASEFTENASVSAPAPPPPSKALKPTLKTTQSEDADSLPSTPPLSHTNSPAASRDRKAQSNPCSFKSTSSDKDNRTELLKANARLKLQLVEPVLEQQLKAKSLTVLHRFDVDEDFPPPPELSAEAEDDKPENEQNEKKLERRRSSRV